MRQWQRLPTRRMYCVGSLLNMCRLRRRLWKFSPQVSLTSFLILVSHTNDSSVKTIHETTQDIDRGVKRLRQLGDDQEYQAVINWLTPVNYALQQNDFIARRQEGTGEWFLNSTEFKQWLSQSKQTLFCPGMPGAGKTMITATVIDHLYRTYQNKPKTSITYIYCNFRQQHQQRYTDLLTKES